MKIAQIAPLAESCPPKLYGGTERIVSFLTEELVRQGHDVTLFASGDSLTNATLVPCSKQALRLDLSVKDMVPYHIMMIDEVRRRMRDFDVLHFHIDHLHYPIVRSHPGRILTTLHGRLDLPDLLPFYSRTPACIDFGIATPANAARELAWNRAARTAARPAALSKRTARRLSGIPGADFTRERT